MTAIQPQTIAESLFRRLNDARYMKTITPLFKSALLKDIAKLEPIALDLALSMKGNLYALLNQKEQAIHCYKKALEINRSALNLYNLGFTYETFNQFECAFNYYRQALDKASDSEISVLKALSDRFIYFFSCAELINVKQKLDKLRYVNNADIILKLRERFTSDNSMFAFGCDLNTIIGEHIPSRFICGENFRQIEGRLHIVYMVKYTNEDDIELVCECNEKLTDFFVKFSMDHQVDLDDISIYCEVME